MDRCSDATVAFAVSALKSGEAVIFPTDTVYGVGVAVRFAEGPMRLFELKRRDEGKPVAWLVSDIEDLLVFGRDVPPVAVELARRYWPGPLTLVVRASEHVPAAFRSQAGTIGLRMPDSALALKLARDAASPIAATSANFSGDPSPCVCSEVSPEFASQVGCFLTDDASQSGLASTVLDCTSADLRIIREGGITRADIDRVARTCETGA